jgi:hypothetical protein
LVRGVSDADVFDGAVVDFESGFAVYHLDDAEFFTALGAERFGEIGCPF